MTATQADARPTTGWMLGMSSWMLSTAIPGPMFAWAGFLLVGIVGRMRRWTIVGVVMAGLAIIAALPVWGQFQPLIAAAVYLGGMVLALVANPSWLRAMWARRASRPATTSARASSRTRTSAASSSTRSSNRRRGASTTQTSSKAATSRAASATTRERTDAEKLAERAGASSATYFAQPAAPADPVDVNTANADELATLPGITRTRARRLLKARTKQGGFMNLDAFATAAGLQPHELVRLREAAVCSRPPRGPRQFGRRVDY
ncbi:hypothetical protein FM104_12390 [Microbacterium esteraromaticum]|uniref:Helix-hairpin-helix domain-containing protein n=1 Tax=Microbacterium esteraromaticum TaxID=57043 RepID=A0A1R4KFS0_9MICO|nr:helix-hairpin-helix domain-containing protein [Microbacterium esteraromaticum]SJN43118.1 hypothetical protein FM104_12390 [Microbacterium esteraromaticum]